MLSEEQIQSLFVFCKKHFVHHYDVQNELVDHLANAIEEKMAADKKLTFEKALEIVYAGFGYKGFAGIVQERSITLKDKCTKMQKNIFKSYFTWPKAIKTFCLFLVLISTYRFLDTYTQAIIICVFFMVLAIFEVVISVRENYFRKKQLKRLMITDMGTVSSIFNVSSFVQMFVFLNDPIYVFEKALNNYGFLGYCVFMIVLLLLLLVVLSYRNLINKVRTVAKKEYPLAFEIAA